MNTSISKRQRRILLGCAVLSFFILILIGIFAPEESDGIYSIEISPIDDPEATTSGTADIYYNEDNGNFYFETITLETGEVIYLYDEATPVNFDEANVIYDESEQYWNVYVNEQVNQLSTLDRVKIIIPNILYWVLIFTLFFLKTFINDLIVILKVSKDDPDNFHKLDSFAHKMGSKIEQWRDKTTNLVIISRLSKVVALIMALVWFLNQYNVI